MFSVFRCCEVLSTLFLFSINNLSLLCFHCTIDLMKARVILAETLLFQISVGEKEGMCKSLWSVCTRAGFGVQEVMTDCPSEISSSVMTKSMQLFLV